MRTSTKSRTSNLEFRIGIIVDAGPSLGYGHAVRCLRLANALTDAASIVFYPLSESCREFLVSSATNPKFEIRDSQAQIDSLAPLVITDLRESHGITADIHRQGSRHLSIHDLGLAQCRSNVAIDGSITRLFPYPEDKKRALFAGPQYMITRRYGLHHIRRRINRQLCAKDFRRCPGARTKACNHTRLRWIGADE